ncbi:uncharacterized protein C2845_PM15G12880 [Panicum miliaceum]|uniref:Uncharacterized protein n=1 Tax=Panicum miliaceum TaxID=4540 RepID=A0A3L6Q3X5_PANMI|nr:uncharacterized protein C2845_PM15G12880 [Panicum miliaceum]
MAVEPLLEEASLPSRTAYAPSPLVANPASSRRVAAGAARRLPRVRDAHWWPSPGTLVVARRWPTVPPPAIRGQGTRRAGFGEVASGDGSTRALCSRRRAGPPRPRGSASYRVATRLAPPAFRTSAAARPRDLSGGFRGAQGAIRGQARRWPRRVGDATRSLLQAELRAPRLPTYSGSSSSLTHWDQGDPVWAISQATTISDLIGLSLDFFILPLLNSGWIARPVGFSDAPHKQYALDL